MQRKPISRRKFVQRTLGTVAAASAATFGYTWRIEPHWIEVVHRTLPIAHLPPALVGKTLVQISDLHVGPVVDETYITAAMDRVSGLRADFVVITGDFMTTHGPEQVPAVVRVISHLRPGKLGTIAIMGNHDYGLGWQSIAAADALSSAVQKMGIVMLRNQMIDVLGLQIAGLDDLWGPYFNPAQATAGIDPNRASLVLCHNPDGADRSGWGGYRGWILAGHTHGGQCKPPFLPPPLLPVSNRRYTSGAFDLFDGRMMYINRGLGYLHRVRFNARPEITVHTLTA